MSVTTKGHLKRSAACVALASGLLFSQPATAGEVALKSTDGTMNLIGELVSFEDGTYSIRTPLGVLSVNASEVRCEGAACPTFEFTPDVAIAGSDAIGLGVMPLLMSGFAATMDADAEMSNPAKGQTLAKFIGDGGFGDQIGTYLVSATTDSDAFSALLEGAASVGMSARRITKDEARALRADGAGNMVSPSQERVIAVDSMVVITHPSNSVQELNKEQLRGIFSGKITNWSQLGGEDRNINVIMQDDQSASFDYFMSYLFDDFRPEFLPAAIAPDNQEVSNVVYRDRNAIGFVGYAFLRGANPVTLINECGIATTADAFSAKTEEYDLSRRMYLYNRSDSLDSQSEAFLEFAISSEADGVIGKSGFIDLGILRREQGADSDRAQALSDAVSSYDAGYEAELMGEMLSTMEEFDRLSTTFRFRTGSSKIDERGRFDMQRLIAHLEDMPAGTEINLVGFTDSVGAFDANRRLSEGRASAVLEELNKTAGDKLAHVTMRTLGFGEISPSACNVSDRGKAINRRVEVWISNKS